MLAASAKWSTAQGGEWGGDLSALRGRRQGVSWASVLSPSLHPSVLSLFLLLLRSPHRYAMLSTTFCDILRRVLSFSFTAEMRPLKWYLPPPPLGSAVMV